MRKSRPRPIAKLRRLPIATCLAVFLSALLGCDKFMAPKPLGEVLIYEVDTDALQNGQTVDMIQLVCAVDQRLNSGATKLAVVKGFYDRRFEVALLRKNDADKNRVEKLLATDGSLEFRVLADKRNNKEIIERALADPSKSILSDDNGKRLAWWVPVRAEVECEIGNYPDIVLRKIKQGDREIAEVLVVDDIYNVTGEYIKDARVGTDSMGRPCVMIFFTDEGGRRFGELTGKHLPDELTGFNYKLGIIFDGVLYSAPRINSTIHRSAEISGTFTPEQVQDMVLVLGGGSLPVKVRPVEKKAPPKE